MLRATLVLVDFDVVFGDRAGHVQALSAVTGTGRAYPSEAWLSDRYLSEVANAHLVLPTDHELDFLIPRPPSFAGIFQL